MDVFRKTFNKRNHIQTMNSTFILGLKINSQIWVSLAILRLKFRWIAIYKFNIFIYINFNSKIIPSISEPTDLNGHNNFISIARALFYILIYFICQTVANDYIILRSGLLNRIVGTSKLPFWNKRPTYYIITN